MRHNTETAPAPSGVEAAPTKTNVPRATQWVKDNTCNDLTSPWLRCPDHFGGECINTDHRTLTPNGAAFFWGCLVRDYKRTCPRLDAILEADDD